jgi:putative exosortase-associated protein (TIGR04073 family)
VLIRIPTIIAFSPKGDFMRPCIAFLTLLIVVGCIFPAFAQETQRPDVIVEKMSFKLARGFTNAATCIVEVPKQIYLTGRDRGAVGYAIGPLKGIGMTLYRAFAGVTETVLFLVPQPGYYDSMIDPDFVWKGWEDNRPDPSRSRESEATEVSDGSREK